MFLMICISQCLSDLIFSHSGWPPKMLYNFNHLEVVTNLGFMLFLLVIFVSLSSLSNEYSLTFYYITNNKGDGVVNCSRSLMKDLWSYNVIFNVFFYKKSIF